MERSDAPAHRTRDDADAPVDDLATGPPLRSIVLVGLMSAGLAVAAIALLFQDGRMLQANGATSWWWAVAIVAGFALADRFTFYVEFQRQAITFTMSEIPTIFALIYLGPVVAVVARATVGVAMIYARGRPPLYKTAFNFALFSFEVAFAFALLSAWTTAVGDSPMLLVVGAVLSVAAACTLQSVFVFAAIACFEGDFLERFLRGLPSAAATASIGALVGATTLAPTFVGPSFLVLSAMPVVAVWLIMAGHGRLRQSHRDLEAVHAFAAAMGRSLDIDELANTALRQLREQLRAESAAIIIDEAGAEDVRSWASGAVPTIDDVDLDDTVIDEEQDLMIAPLRRGDEIIGRVIVHDRAGVSDAFAPDDAQRLDAFATQLSGALTNALVHARMEHDASHDLLTGELNRAAFDRLVKQRLASRPRCAATMMIDLDNFKEVNDTLGHQVGDHVLCEFARRVKDLLEPTDVFARFGGDEFAVYLERIDERAVRAVADSMLSASYTAISLDGLDVVVTTSVGIAMVDDQDVGAGSLLRRADIAMYAAKGQRSGAETYSEDIDRRTPERLSLLGDLRHALDEWTMEVHYQPKIALDSSAVVGAEALVRWNHETRGWVGPDEFIPLAEDSGLVRLLTDQVIADSLATLNSWRALGHDLSVAVNLSTLDLLDELLADRVSRHLDRHGLDASCLTLEITESSLMVETPRVMSTIAELDRLGVKLALDDFGTGFSSLNYLRQLPVTELKIDRSFVGNLLLDQQDEVIVKSTIDLGRNLGLTVVAEGIENDRVIGRLRRLGCQYGQGFAISRALPGDVFVRWLDTWTGDSGRLDLAPVVPLGSLRT